MREDINFKGADTESDFWLISIRFCASAVNFGGKPQIFGSLKFTYNEWVEAASNHISSYLNGKRKVLNLQMYRVVSRLMPLHNVLSTKTIIIIEMDSSVLKVEV